MMVHVTIVRYLQEKYYLYTLADDPDHKPEVPALALQRAVKFIENKHNIKLKRVCRQSDNCAMQYVKFSLNMLK